MQKIIKITNGLARREEWQMAEPVNFTLCDGEHIAIIGENASGKTMLVNMITGAHPLIVPLPEYDFTPSQKQYVSDNIKYISFEDAYGSSNNHYYLQQRWNMHDINDDTPTARQVLDEAYALSGKDSKSHQSLRERLYEAFGISHMLDKFIISLSSGELRKLHLVKNLLSSPRVLILDNPFIGLDAETRELLKQLLAILSKEFMLQIILVLSKTDEIPDFITHIVELRNMHVMPKVTAKNYLDTHRNAPKRSLISDLEKAEIKKMIASLPTSVDPQIECINEIVKLNNVNIRYGKRTILKDLCWTIRKGDKWALNGQNGAGKSTLLSLICADNPQSYACDITLFGKERGTGESIWEIKKHIGYVSPEMHRAYRHNIPAIRIVASGMKDSVGLYTKPTQEEYDRCETWLKIFGIQNLKERPFLSLSSGEQRLILLARAFVKDPLLLILDEPLHGLDNRNREKVRYIINTYASLKDKTIVMVSHYQEEYPTCIDKKKCLVTNNDYNDILEQSKTNIK